MYDYDARPRSVPMDGIEIGHLHQVADRFKQVQIECRDALEIISLYDGQNTLIYFDPPYVGSTRTNRKYYAHEVNDGFHVEAAERLRKATGMVVVSGYRSELYADLYELHGWIRRDSSSVATNGAKRVESIWLSPNTQRALGSRVNYVQNTML